ncbi:MAG TPA: class I SAM-dependent methyltransferase [Polyangiaceae bacterium]|nr:class I SAM-dependent methyltransferase [Polyangiaceae bacterium]
MSDLEDRKRLHSGAYVEAFEHMPVSRLERLVPLLNLRGDEKLADFACGNGMLLPLIHERVASYHGVDFSADFIRAARRRATANGIGNCTFHCQDVVEFCSEHPGAFDVATAFDFSEHIHDDEFVAIFAAIRASLKPGGRLLLHTPNLDFFMERLKDWGVLPQFPEHVAVRTAEAHTRLLVSCGFSEQRVRVRKLAHYNVLRVVHPLHHLPLIGRFFAARLVIECTN